MRFGVGAFRRMYQAVKYRIGTKPVLRKQPVAGCFPGLFRCLQRGRLSACYRLQFGNAFRVQRVMARAVRIDIVPQGVKRALREA